MVYFFEHECIFWGLCARMLGVVQMLGLSERVSICVFVHVAQMCACLDFWGRMRDVFIKYEILLKNIISYSINLRHVQIGGVRVRQ